MADDDFLNLFDAFVKWPARLGKEGPFLENFLQGAGARSVVDAGAGSGRHAAYLAAKGYNVFATDVAECMVDEARRYAAEQGAELEAIRCSFEDLPAHIKAPQDAVICMGNSLSMLPSREAVHRAVRGFHRVLRPKGLVVLHLLNYRGLRARNKRASNPTLLDEGGLLVKVFDLEPESTRVNFLRLFEKEPGVWRTEHRAAPLLPLSREEMEEILGLEGFGDVRTFGDATGKPYEPDASYDLFMAAMKGSGEG